MHNGKKIGVGVITCNRTDFFKKCIDSISEDWYDELVVINDGDKLKKEDIPEKLLKETRKDNAKMITNDNNLGVAKTKNKAMQYLLDKDCDYIIIVEDDMLFKDNIFNAYIDTYLNTSIHHFMFAYHGPANKGGVSKGVPKPNVVYRFKDNGNAEIALNPHCVGAVCFYTRECLEDVGLIDEEFKNAFDHVEHTYRLAKAGYTTPFWWFADIRNSLDYVEEQACSEESSAIRKGNQHRTNINASAALFAQKHGLGIGNIPRLNKETVKKIVVGILKKNEPV